jgi:hypothetical protein
MARPPMTAIIVLSVPGEELSHELGDPWPTASDQEMNMSLHEHPSIYGGLRFDNVFPQPVKKARPILIVSKNR